MLVGKECQKYDIQSVLNSIGDLIAREMKQIQLTSARRWDSRVGFHAKLATSLKLRQPTEIVRDYVVSIMITFEQQNCPPCGWNSKSTTYYPKDMVEVLTWLFEVDDIEWTKNFSMSIIRSVLKTNV